MTRVTFEADWMIRLMLLAAAILVVFTDTVWHQYGGHHHTPALVDAR
jgi:hypothetical protein